jgi:hypothetical protein
VINDQGETRQFREDVIGIPLTVTWGRRAYNATIGREPEYRYTFYSLADGDSLAFFQFASDDAYDALKVLRPEEGQHFAMLVELGSLRQDLTAHPSDTIKVSGNRPRL